MSGERSAARSWSLGAIAASLVLVAIYLAAGGACYAPAKTQDPCKHRAWPNPEGLQQILQQFTLSALDGAACKLGVRARPWPGPWRPKAREQFASATTSTTPSWRGRYGRPAACGRRCRRSRGPRPVPRRARGRRSDHPARPGDRTDPQRQLDLQVAGLPRPRQGPARRVPALAAPGRGSLFIELEAPALRIPGDSCAEVFRAWCRGRRRA